jgi:NAD(P)-dependent dehydrogenase (short-subunit alcohol dehydrogenase family)
MANELLGQVAIITGAGRGIGRAIATVFAEAGAAVACTARTLNEITETAEIISAAGGRAFAIRCDVRDKAQIAFAVRQIEQSLGPIDVLVNNAAIAGPKGWFIDMDVDDWLACLDTNLGGAARFTHNVLPAMVARGRGRIINISSRAAALPAVPAPGGSSYLVSKLALSRFTELLASELQLHGVFVFAADPGGVMTRLAEEMAIGEGAAPEMIRGFMQSGVLLAPEVPARFCLRLAAGEADALTGLHLGFDGDLTALVSEVEEIRRTERLTMRLRR